MTHYLSRSDAQKIALHSQQLPVARECGLAGTRRIIQHLGYVQIDTISVVMRAHHHTLWNRVKQYSEQSINQLVQKGEVFEYWSHAAAYLPIEDFRYSLVRKQAIAEGAKHWFEKDHKVMREVLARITAEGPLQAKDFANDTNQPIGWWDWKPAKRALEQLFMEGTLMAVERRGFQKVYDLTERALPDGVDLTPPSEEDYARYLIADYLRANGIAKLNEFGHLRKGVKPLLKRVYGHMLEEEILTEVSVKGETYVTTPTAIALLQRPLSRQRLCLLSPFDNLIIQRQRVRDLFDFDYQIECYLPAEKRRYGYFTLPILWQGRLVARLDAKAHRGQKHFVVNRLFIEASLLERERLPFAAALAERLVAYAAANGCDSVGVDTVDPAMQVPLMAELRLRNALIG